MAHEVLFAAIKRPWCPLKKQSKPSQHLFSIIDLAKCTANKKTTGL
jgi:hypothetical protein